MKRKIIGKNSKSTNTSLAEIDINGKKAKMTEATLLKLSIVVAILVVFVLCPISVDFFGLHCNKKSAKKQEAAWQKK